MTIDSDYWEKDCKYKLGDYLWLINDSMTDAFKLKIGQESIHLVENVVKCKYVHCEGGYVFTTARTFETKEDAINAILKYNKSIIKK